MIRIEELSKSYVTFGQGAVAAVMNVSFELRKGEFYTLLGPSGCGKTTTLRCIAGFETPDNGDIWISDQLVFSRARRLNVSCHKRKFGIVFQSYALWPHLNVFDNVAFPLTYGRNRVGKGEIKERVMGALRLVGLETLADRPTPLLSGGQQQRVALARALVHEPDALLLDEPLSNLDAKLRETMRFEIRQLIKRLGITTLFVTHDQVEALSMSDRIAVMQNGRVVQEGSPFDVYQKPAERFVAEFLGTANLVEGVISEARDQGAMLETPLGRLVCKMDTASVPGSRVGIVIRPEQIQLRETDGGAGENCFVAEISDLTFLGEDWDCRLTVRDSVLRAKFPATSTYDRGQVVHVQIPKEFCRVLRR